MTNTFENYAIVYEVMQADITYTERGIKDVCSFVFHGRGRIEYKLENEP